MEEMESKLENGIIILNATTFKYYVEENPRPYDVVIMMSRTKDYCPHCGSVFRDGYRPMVYSFMSDRNNLKLTENKG